LIFLLIILIAFTIKSFFIHQLWGTGIPQSDDANQYIGHSKFVVERGRLTASYFYTPFERTRPPGYYALLGSFSILSGIDAKIVFEIFFYVLNFVFLLIIFLFAREFFSSKTAYLAIFLCIFIPTSGQYHGPLWATPEFLSLIFLFLSLYLLKTAKELKNLILLFASSLLTFLSHHNALTLFPVSMVYILLDKKTGVIKDKRFYVILLSFATFFITWVLPQWSLFLSSFQEAERGLDINPESFHRWIFFEHFWEYNMIPTLFLPIYFIFAWRERISYSILPLFIFVTWFPQNFFIYGWRFYTILVPFIWILFSHSLVKLSRVKVLVPILICLIFISCYSGYINDQKLISSWKPANREFVINGEITDPSDLRLLANLSKTNKPYIPSGLNFSRKFLLGAGLYNEPTNKYENAYYLLSTKAREFPLVEKSNHFYLYSIKNQSSTKIAQLSLFYPEH
jgi:hypothetical protein